ncbi:MAG: hypothetical protein ACJAU6_002266 [Alphaproteobacteria bacterium]|jgi:hypothetical protein
MKIPASREQRSNLRAFGYRYMADAIALSVVGPLFEPLLSTDRFRESAAKEAM